MRQFLIIQDQHASVKTISCKLKIYGLHTSLCAKLISGVLLLNIETGQYVREKKGRKGDLFCVVSK